MVKKRNRDPEVLPEAPPVNRGDDSGSDDVGQNLRGERTRAKLIGL